MIHLTPKDRLVHKASWHDAKLAEGARLNAKHAKMLAADYQATKERLFADAVRAKLGVLPQPALLKDRLSVYKPKKSRLNWLTLDDEAIAIFTDPETTTKGYRFLMTWYFRSLVDTTGN
jgi:hypothetical protein